MIEEKDEVTEEKEDEVVVEDDKKSDDIAEETDEKKEEEKEDYEKDSETVSAGKHNQAIRKLREAELKLREKEAELERVRTKAPEKEEDDDDEDDEDIFEEKKKDIDIESLVDAKVKPVLEKLNQREAEEKKNQRTAFFKKHPQYLKDSEKWQALLDEVDNFNPNSKDGYYKQLVKAHRIISSDDDGESPEIEKKKREMASDSASKGDGSQKAADRKSPEDERADRLAKKMPIGFTYTGK